jgi:hypothetical protein
MVRKQYSGPATRGTSRDTVKTDFQGIRSDSMRKLPWSLPAQPSKVGEDNYLSH